jgi:hypothetical protein
LPLDLVGNVCGALKAVVVMKGTFKTTAVIKLVDCHSDLVFLSEEGVSKVKEFGKAYNLAIRDASHSFEGLNYKYDQKDIDSNSGLKNSDSKTETVAVDMQVEEETKEATKSPLQSSEESVVEEVSYLTAEVIPNGYKLINSLTLQVEYIIHASDIENTFIIKDKSGIIFKKGNGWVRQYIENERTMLELLEIRF